MTEYERGYDDGYKNASKAVAEWMNDSDVRIEKLEKLVGMIRGCVCDIDERIEELEKK